MIALQLKTELDPIAIYAAIVATAGFLFQLAQWLKSGPRLKVSVSPDMRLSGNSRGLDSYVSVVVRNVGTAATTMTHLSFHEVKWQFGLKRKNTNSWIVISPIGSELPKIIEPGEQAVMLVLQNDTMASLAALKSLYFEVQHVKSERPIRIRCQPFKSQIEVP